MLSLMVRAVLILSMASVVLSINCVYDSRKLVEGKVLCSNNKVFVLGILKISTTSGTKQTPCVFNRFTNRISWRLAHYRDEHLSINVNDIPKLPTSYTMDPARANDAGNQIRYKLKIANEGIYTENFYLPGVVKFKINDVGILMSYQQAEFTHVDIICTPTCTPVSSSIKLQEKVFVKYDINGTYQDTTCQTFSTEKKIIETVVNSGPNMLNIIKNFESLRSYSTSVEEVQSFSKESQVTFTWEIGSELEVSGSLGFSEVSASVTARIGGETTSTTSSEVSRGSSKGSTTEIKESHNYEISIPPNSTLEISKGKNRIRCVKPYLGTIMISYPDYEVPSETMDESYQVVLDSMEISDSYEFKVYSIN